MVLELATRCLLSSTKRRGSVNVEQTIDVDFVHTNRHRMVKVRCDSGANDLTYTNKNC